MLDTIVLATPNDFDRVWQLYTDVCTQMPHDQFSPLWTLGVFPAEEDIRDHLAAGELYVGLYEGRIVAAMVLTGHEDSEYADVAWPSGATGDDVGVVHLLCGHPKLRGRGIGSELIMGAIEHFRTAGKRAIHLDVVPGNLAASRIYLAVGFSFVCTHDVYYEDTGTMTFELYEYVY